MSGRGEDGLAKGDGKLDALIELCEIGMTQAAAALAKLIGKEVTPDTPRLRTLDEAESEEICRAEQATAVKLRISGSLRGTMLILLGDSGSRIMLRLLVGEAPAQGEPLSELHASALMEVGNIMGSAFLNAIGARVHAPLLPSVPTLLSGAAATLVREAARDLEDAPLAVETEFNIAGTRFSGSFVLIAAHLPAGDGAANEQ